MMIKDTSRFEPFTDQPISLTSESGEWRAPFDLDLDADALEHIYRDPRNGEAFRRASKRAAAHGQDELRRAHRRARRRRTSARRTP